MGEKTLAVYLEEMNRLIKNRKASTAVNSTDSAMQGQGSLIVVVNSATDYPLEGATVVISDAKGEALYNLVTDQSGKTKPVSLPAPLKDETLKPQGQTIVYGLYNVTASAENFVTCSVESIPVFDSVVSIQQFSLLDIKASGGQNVPQSQNEVNPYNL